MEESCLFLSLYTLHSSFVCPLTRPHSSIVTSVNVSWKTSSTTAVSRCHTSISQAQIFMVVHFVHVVYSNWQVSFSVDLSFQFSSCRQQPMNSEKIKVVTAGLCQSLERLNKNELTCNPNISVKDEQLGGWFFFFLSSGKKMVFFKIVWRKGLCGCGLFVCCVQSRLKPLERTASHSQQRHLLTCWPVCAGLTGLNYCEHLELVIWFRTTDSSWGQHSR